MTYLQFEEVTPSDTVGYTSGLADALYIGTGGDVAVVDKDGTAVTFANVPDSSYLFVKSIRVNDTGTTAADIVALYDALR